MRKGGKILNHGYKGIVMNVYNESKRDKNTLYMEILNSDVEKIELIGIDMKKMEIYRDKKDELLMILRKIGEIGDILVKKFVYGSIIDTNESNFKNEMRGYMRLFKIFGRNIEKYTTIKAGFEYNRMKIYGIICKDAYYVFLERCNKTLEEIRFDKKTYDKMEREIREVLDILDDNNYIHNDIKPDNIIYCKKVNRFKLVDWDLSYDYGSKKALKDISMFKNGSFIYNHPIKFENSGLNDVVYEIGYRLETMLSDRYKYMRKLKSPILLKKKVRDNMIFVRDVNKKHGIRYYMKYYDKYSFVLCLIYLGELNNIKMNDKWINHILSKFNIILHFQ